VILTSHPLRFTLSDMTTSGPIIQVHRDPVVLLTTASRRSGKTRSAICCFAPRC